MLRILFGSAGRRLREKATSDQAIITCGDGATQARGASRLPPPGAPANAVGSIGPERNVTEETSGSPLSFAASFRAHHCAK
jgi:hypothetical protein